MNDKSNPVVESLQIDGDKESSETRKDKISYYVLCTAGSCLTIFICCIAMFFGIVGIVLYVVLNTNRVGGKAIFSAVSGVSGIICLGSFVVQEVQLLFLCITKRGRSRRYPYGLSINLGVTFLFLSLFSWSFFGSVFSFAFGGFDVSEDQDLFLIQAFLQVLSCVLTVLLQLVYVELRVRYLSRIKGTTILGYLFQSMFLIIVGVLGLTLWKVTFPLTPKSYFLSINITCPLLFFLATIILWRSLFLQSIVFLVCLLAIYLYNIVIDFVKFDQNPEYFAGAGYTSLILMVFVGVIASNFNTINTKYKFLNFSSSTMYFGLGRVIYHNTVYSLIPFIGIFIYTSLVNWILELLNRTSHMSFFHPDLGFSRDDFGVALWNDGGIYVLVITYIVYFPSFLRERAYLLPLFIAIRSTFRIIPATHIGIYFSSFSYLYLAVIICFLHPEITIRRYVKFFESKKNVKIEEEQKPSDFIREIEMKKIDVSLSSSVKNIGNSIQKSKKFLKKEGIEESIEKTRTFLLPGLRIVFKVYVGIILVICVIGFSCQTWYHNKIKGNGDYDYELGADIYNGDANQQVQFFVSSVCLLVLSVIVGLYWMELVIPVNLFQIIEIMKNVYKNLLKKRKNQKDAEKTDENLNNENIEDRESEVEGEINEESSTSDQNVGGGGVGTEEVLHIPGPVEKNVIPKDRDIEVEDKNQKTVDDVGFIEEDIISSRDIMKVITFPRSALYKSIWNLIMSVTIVLVGFGFAQIYWGVHMYSDTEAFNRFQMTGLRLGLGCFFLAVLALFNLFIFFDFSLMFITNPRSQLPFRKKMVFYFGKFMSNLQYGTKSYRFLVYETCQSVIIILLTYMFWPFLTKNEYYVFLIVICLGYLLTFKFQFIITETHGQKMLLPKILRPTFLIPMIVLLISLGWFGTPDSGNLVSSIGAREFTKSEIVAVFHVFVIIEIATATNQFKFVCFLIGMSYFLLIDIFEYFSIIYQYGYFHKIFEEFVYMDPQELIFENIYYDFRDLFAFFIGFILTCVHVDFKELYLVVFFGKRLRKEKEKKEDEEEIEKEEEEEGEEIEEEKEGGNEIVEFEGEINKQLLNEEKEEEDVVNIESSDGEVVEDEENHREKGLLENEKLEKLLLIWKIPTLITEVVEKIRDLEPGFEFLKLKFPLKHSYYSVPFFIIYLSHMVISKKYMIKFFLMYLLYFPLIFFTYPKKSDKKSFLKWRKVLKLTEKRLLFYGVIVITGIALGICIGLSYKHDSVFYVFIAIYIIQSFLWQLIVFVFQRFNNVSRSNYQFYEVFKEKFTMKWIAIMNCMSHFVRYLSIMSMLFVIHLVHSYAGFLFILLYLIVILILQGDVYYLISFPIVLTGSLGYFVYVTVPSSTVKDWFLYPLIVTCFVSMVMFIIGRSTNIFSLSTLFPIKPISYLRKNEIYRSLNKLFFEVFWVYSFIAAFVVAALTGKEWYGIPGFFFTGVIFLRAIICRSTNQLVLAITFSIGQMIYLGAYYPDWGWIPPLAMLVVFCFMSITALQLTKHKKKNVEKVLMIGIQLGIVMVLFGFTFAFFGKENASSVVTLIFAVYSFWTCCVMGSFVFLFAFPLITWLSTYIQLKQAFLKDDSPDYLKDGDVFYYSMYPAFVHVFFLYVVSQSGILFVFKSPRVRNLCLYPAVKLYRIIEPFFTLLKDYYNDLCFFIEYLFDRAQIVLFCTKVESYSDRKRRMHEYREEEKREKEEARKLRMQTIEAVKNKQNLKEEAFQLEILRNIRKEKNLRGISVDEKDSKELVEREGTFNEELQKLDEKDLEELKIEKEKRNRGLLKDLVLDGSDMLVDNVPIFSDVLGICSIWSDVKSLFVTSQKKEDWEILHHEVDDTIFDQKFGVKEYFTLLIKEIYKNIKFSFVQPYHKLVTHVLLMEMILIGTLTQSFGVLGMISLLIFCVYGFIYRLFYHLLLVPFLTPIVILIGFFIASQVYEISGLTSSYVLFPVIGTSFLITSVVLYSLNSCYDVGLYCYFLKIVSKSEKPVTLEERVIRKVKLEQERLKLIEKKNEEKRIYRGMNDDLGIVIKWAVRFGLLPPFAGVILSTFRLFDCIKICSPTSPLTLPRAGGDLVSAQAHTDHFSILYTTVYYTYFSFAFYLILGPFLSWSTIPLVVTGIFLGIVEIVLSFCCCIFIKRKRNVELKWICGMSRILIAIICGCYFIPYQWIKEFYIAPIVSLFIAFVYSILYAIFMLFIINRCVFVQYRSYKKMRQKKKEEKVKEQIRKGIGHFVEKEYYEALRKFNELTDIDEAFKDKEEGEKVKEILSEWKEKALNIGNTESARNYFLNGQNYLKQKNLNLAIRNLIEGNKLNKSIITDHFLKETIEILETEVIEYLNKCVEFYNNQDVKALGDIIFHIQANQWIECIALNEVICSGKNDYIQRYNTFYQNYSTMVFNAWNNGKSLELEKRYQEAMKIFHTISECKLISGTVVNDVRIRYANCQLKIQASMVSSGGVIVDNVNSHRQLPSVSKRGLVMEDQIDRNESENVIEIIASEEGESSTSESEEDDPYIKVKKNETKEPSKVNFVKSEENDGGLLTILDSNSTLLEFMGNNWETVKQMVIQMMMEKGK